MLCTYSILVGSGVQQVRGDMAQLNCKMYSHPSIWWEVIWLKVTYGLPIQTNDTHYTPIQTKLNHPPIQTKPHSAVDHNNLDEVDAECYLCTPFQFPWCLGTQITDIVQQCTWCCREMMSLPQNLGIKTKCLNWGITRTFRRIRSSRLQGVADKWA